MDLGIQSLVVEGGGDSFGGPCCTRAPKIEVVPKDDLLDQQIWNHIFPILNKELHFSKFGGLQEYGGKGSMLGLMCCISSIIQRKTIRVFNSVHFFNMQYADF